MFHIMGSSVKGLKIAWTGEKFKALMDLVFTPAPSQSSQHAVSQQPLWLDPLVRWSAAAFLQLLDKPPADDARYNLLRAAAGTYRDMHKVHDQFTQELFQCGRSAPEISRLGTSPVLVTVHCPRRRKDWSAVAAADASRWAQVSLDEHRLPSVTWMSHAHRLAPSAACRSKGLMLMRLTWSIAARRQCNWSAVSAADASRWAAAFAEDSFGDALFASALVMLQRPDVPAAVRVSSDIAYVPLLAHAFSPFCAQSLSSRRGR
jgi:hypothetical protein